MSPFSKVLSMESFTQVPAGQFYLESSAASVAFQGVVGTCWPVTGCGKSIYQATQEVKFIITFPSFFLLDPPGLCFMLQTDGAEEFQVFADVI